MFIYIFLRLLEKILPYFIYKLFSSSLGQKYIVLS